ncbi:MAG: hypothetical protein C5B60_04075 [Chloroflexi bacterium]|nr:MAG: hypothetical protein C5B60_04075 [Chloroflexota bacterium]
MSRRKKRTLSEAINEAAAVANSHPPEKWWYEFAHALALLDYRIVPKSWVRPTSLEVSRAYNEIIAGVKAEGRAERRAQRIEKRRSRFHVVK